MVAEKEDEDSHTMTPEEREELSALREQMDLHSLGDRPSSIAAEKLGRLIELEAREAADRERGCK